MNRQLTTAARSKRVLVAVGVATTTLLGVGISHAAALDRPATPGAPYVIESGSGYVELQWRSVPDAVGYNVYNALTHEIQEPQADGITTDEAYVELDGLARGEHVFYIKAVGADGTTSWRSGFRTVTSNGVLPEAICETDVAQIDQFSATTTVRAGVGDDLGVVAAEMATLADDKVVATGPANEPLSIDPEKFAENGRVRFLVRYLNDDGLVVCWSGALDAAISVRPERPGVPHKPVVVELSGQTVGLSFPGDPDSDNAEYQLFDADTAELLYQGEAPAVTLELALGQHSVYARAVDSNGTTSWRSGAQTFTVTDGGDSALTLVGVVDSVATIEWDGPAGFTQILDCDSRTILKSTHGHRVFLNLNNGSISVCVITYDDDRSPIWTSNRVTIFNGDPILN